MLTITKSLEKKMVKYPLYSQDGKGMNAKVICKVFNPYGSGTWIITEAGKEDGEWIFFGYCSLYYGEWEWCYVSFKELSETMVNVFGCKMPLEFDRFVPNGATVKDLVEE